MKYNFTKEEIENSAKKSRSYRQMIYDLNMSESGSSYALIKKMIKDYDININHFCHGRWCKNKKYTEEVALRKMNVILKNDVNFKTATLKERLISNGLKEYKCEKCGCDGIWQGEKITLELQHINGDHYDNRFENLQILCPNCHYQTSSYRKRMNIRKNKPIDPKKLHTKKCKNCGKEFKTENKKINFCYEECKNNFKIKNEKEIIESIKKYSGECSNFIELGKKIGVSKTTVRNYMTTLGINESFKSKYSFHAKKLINMI